MGSIAYTKRFAFASAQAYKISKAGMNMLTAQYAMELEKEGFTCFAVTPGVSTQCQPSITNSYKRFPLTQTVVAQNRHG